MIMLYKIGKDFFFQFYLQFYAKGMKNSSLEKSLHLYNPVPQNTFFFSFSPALMTEKSKVWEWTKTN